MEKIDWFDWRKHESSKVHATRFAVTKGMASRAEPMRPTAENTESKVSWKMILRFKLWIWADMNTCISDLVKSKATSVLGTAVVIRLSRK